MTMAVAQNGVEICATSRSERDIEDLVSELNENCFKALGVELASQPKEMPREWFQEHVEDSVRKELFTRAVFCDQNSGIDVLEI